MNDMDDLSWYLGCAFERDKMEGVMKMRQTVFVDSLYVLIYSMYVYVCMIISYSEGKDQPGKVANPAHGQLNWENGCFPVPVRA